MLGNLSAFSYAHWPVDFCHKEMDAASKRPNPFTSVFWYVGGAACFALNTALIPLTICIDIVRGVALFFFAFLNTKPEEAVDMFLNFVVISPPQQLLALKVTLLSILPFSLIGITPLSTLTWPLSKELSKLAVSSLSSWLFEERGFSIYNLPDVRQAHSHLSY